MTTKEGVSTSSGGPPQGDEAEASLLRSLERRRSKTTTRTANGTTAEWTSAVPGERPPLAHAVPPALDEAAGGSGGGSHAHQSDLANTRARIKWLKLNVLAKKAKGGWDAIDFAAVAGGGDGQQGVPLTESNVLEIVAENVVDTAETLPVVTSAPDDNEVAVKAEGDDDGIFGGIGGENPEVGDSNFAVADTDMDRLITGAAAVEHLFDDTSSIASSITSASSWVTSGTADESLPLTDAGRARKKRRKKKMHKRVRKWVRRTFRTPVWKALSPSVVGPKLWSFFTRTFLALIVPLLAAAAILFYTLGNPTPDFLEQKDFTSLSYWLVFIARQLTTLGLGGMSAYILVEVMAMRSKLCVKLFGPHLTLLLINADGWPLHFTCWALWDLFILHGDNTFQQNWLFFADIQLFSPANPGSILTSVVYFRALVALLVAGLAAAVKRSVVAVYFGKKTFRRFKHDLEKLLIDVLIVTEVGHLSSEMEEVFDEEEDDEDDDDDDDDDKIDRRSATRNIKTRWTSMAKVTFDDKDDDHDDLSEQDSGEFEKKNILRSDSYRNSSSSEIIGMKSLLTRWEEPVNKLDKEVDPSISDMLQFRKALVFMDGDHPFSREFGPAQTRDECISSAQDTYQRLRFIDPEATSLSFDALTVLALDEHGVYDQRKQQVLKRVFRPDRYNELTELAFVQSCDSVYRKLRFFRASVGNSSVIDKVIQDGMEKVFGFLLLLVICAIMHYNPMTLLVSLSTLVVSMSFAFGAAMSKYVEGVLLIVARSPYSVGDRIMIVGSENTTADSGTRYSWFVEDINLYSTTLRFAGTNEVATITNGSIAASRIINCARSPKALVSLTIRYTIFMTDKQVSDLETALKKYVKDFPRTWTQVIYFSSSGMDPDYEWIDYTMIIQHRKTWQDAMEIARDKARLHKFLYETGSELNIVYDSPINRIRLFPGDTSMVDAVKEAGLKALTKG